MKAAYAETDHMPREVATALLTTPGTRLTPAMRRSCRLAREQTITSHCPIKRGPNDGEYFFDSAKRAKKANEKYLAGLHKHGIVALSRRLKRVVAKRRSLEYAYQDSLDESKRKDIFKRAVQLDKQQNAIINEINSRNKRSTIANHKARKQYGRI